MLTMRRSRAAEYGEVLEFIAGQFNAPVESFAGMSHIYAPQPSVMRQTYLAVRDDRTVGAYGIFARRLRAGAAELAAAGIGGVCTDRTRRGRGVMAFMIEAGDRIMRDAGIDVACLGGDRFRYGAFGWDGGGRIHSFRLTRRCLERNGMQPGPVRRYRASTDWARLRRAHDALRYRLVRPKSYFSRVIGRPGLNVLVSDKPRKFAYAIYRDPDRLEEVAGHPDGIGAIVRRQLVRGELDVVHVDTGPEDSDLFRWLVRCGEHSRPHIWGSWQIKILDLASTLRKLIPELRRRAPRGLHDGRVTLVMRDSDQAATLRYGRRFAVDRRTSARKLVLSDMEMARLILGTFPLIESFGLTGPLADLAAFLPVPWHWPVFDRV